MPVVNMSFNKILGENYKFAKKDFSVDGNLSIENIELDKLTLRNKSVLNVVDISFSYDVNYTSQTDKDKKLGYIQIRGSLVYTDDEEKLKELVSYWNENKRLPKTISLDVLNYVLSKTQLQAAILSKDINLPIPFKIPRLVKQK